MREKHFYSRELTTTCLLVLFTLIGSSSVFARKDELTDAQRKAVVCGPNAVILFTTICGVDVDDQMIDEMDLTVQGTTLAELKSACQRLGLETELLHFAPADADHVRLPAIVHSKTGETDHYYVWYRVTDQKVYAFDSTTGQKVTISRKKLSNFWTGYVVVPKQFAQRNIWLSAAALEKMKLSFAIALVTWAAGSIATILLASSRRERGALVKAAHSPVIGAVIVLTVTAGNAGSVQGRQTRASVLEDDKEVSVESTFSRGSWRDSYHGGQNCLYLFLQLNGIDVAYDEVVLPGGGAPQTLSELSQVAKNNGAHAVARRLTPTELLRLKNPSIVHLDGDNTEAGCFIVLIQQQDERIAFMNGPSATIEVMDREDFLRRWSGLCVVKQQSFLGSSVEYAVGCLGAVFSVGFYKFVRRNRRVAHVQG